jgi:flagellar motor component MotA
MGSRVAAAFTLVVIGIIVADILTHPEGTKAAANGLSSILTPTYSALLGGGR